jgi:SAM-dependent methyltransferase
MTGPIAHSEYFSRDGGAARFRAQSMLPRRKPDSLNASAMSIDARVAAQVERETAFWSTDPFERPGADTIENFLNKTQEAAIFFQLFQEHEAVFRAARNIVEVGGGQGWASCIVKRQLPDAHVVLTDAVDEAIQGRVIWERVLSTRLDGAFAAPAQALPCDDGTVDLVFCYAAAHHFVNYTEALRELKRVLSPHGRCLWLYEPSAPRWLQSAAERRVNRKRPDVPEHVIVPQEIVDLAQREGLQCTFEYCTSIAHRGRMATLYYVMLGAVPVLRRMLPCTAHFTLSHRA